MQPLFIMITVLSRVAVSKRIVQWEELRGVTSSSFFLCVRNHLKNTPDFDTQRIFRKGLFRSPPGMVPPVPYPRAPWAVCPVHCCYEYLQ